MEETELSSVLFSSLLHSSIVCFVRSFDWKKLSCLRNCSARCYTPQLFLVCLFLVVDSIQFSSVQSSHLSSSPGRNSFVVSEIITLSKYNFNHARWLEKRGEIILKILAFKGANRDFFFFFYNLLTAPRTVSNKYAKMARAQSCANHVQHIECLSRATCHVTCHVVRRDSSAIKFERVEIAFTLALFYWLNH